MLKNRNKKEAKGRSDEEAGVRKDKREDGEKTNEGYKGKKGKVKDARGVDA